MTLWDNASIDVISSEVEKSPAEETGRRVPAPARLLAGRPHPAGREPLRASRQRLYLALAERGRCALVQPPTKLKRRHFDRRDSGVERFPA